MIFQKRELGRCMYVWPEENESEKGIIDFKACLYTIFTLRDCMLGIQTPDQYF